MSEPVTSFARWLARRGELPSGYAARAGRDRPAVYALAGIRAARIPGFFKTKTLEAIALDTGIPATRLWAEAMDALKHEPRAPRKHVRRASNGENQEAG